MQLEEYEKKKRFFLHSKKEQACSSSIPTLFQCRYETLEQEAIDIGVASELEVIVLLEKLCLFSTDDITTIPFVQVCWNTSN